MSCDEVVIYRNTGQAKTFAIFNVDDDDIETVIDCTGCTAYMQVRATPFANSDPLIDTSTATPPSGAASGLEWINAALGQLHVVWGEVDTRDETKFPKCAGPEYSAQYFCDVVVRDSDGRAKFPPIPVPLLFAENVTSTPE